MDLKVQVIGFNQILTAIYGEELRMSVLLVKAGYSPTQLIQLTQDEYAVLLEIALGFLRDFAGRKGKDERGWRILVRRFGLDGEPKETLQEIAEVWGVSRERIRQIEAKLLKTARSKLYRARLEQRLIDYVYTIIGEPEQPNGLPSLQDVSDSQFLKYVQNVRKDFPNAYVPWAIREDTQLQTLFESGMGIDRIATTMGRTPGVITSRLTKLGIYVPDSEKV